MLDLITDDSFSTDAGGCCRTLRLFSFSWISTCLSVLIDGYYTVLVVYVETELVAELENFQYMFYAILGPEFTGAMVLEDLLIFHLNG